MSEQQNGLALPEKALRTKEVAELLNVSRAWVREHITKARPLLPHIRMGRVVRFRESEIEAFLEKYAVREEI